MRTMWLLGFGMVLFFAFPVEQVMAAFDQGHWMIEAPTPTEHTEMGASALDQLIEVVDGVESPNEGNRWRLVSASSGQLIQSKRAPARHVGAVMAILGTFNEAGVLPVESDPRANQLIRSLIQFQSVFMKNQQSAVHDYLSSALFARWGEQGAMIQDSFDEQGWTTQTLEALVDYSKIHSIWGDARMAEVFRQYYLSPADWVLVEEIFDAARQRFISEGQDIHQMFAIQRERMARGTF
ncbi:MAG: hypothetical protein O2999_00880 [Nitrospirae bacterium]|nr:hypothetical protein [Nitrospirota bacterium]